MGDSILGEKSMTNLVSSVIDIAGFSLGNYALGKADITSDLKFRHVIIFAIVDVAIKRGNLIDAGIRNELWNKWNMRENLYIGLVYLISSAVYDYLTHHGVKSSIMDNAIRAAVGVAVNTVADNVLLENSKYK